VKFGEVVRLARETCRDPAAEGIDRYIGLEHLEPGDLRVRSWGDVSDGTTFTSRVRPGQVLFGKRRAYQRKVAVADFDAVCSGDIYVLESANPDVLLPELLPFLCQTDAFFEHAVGTSAGSLSPRTNWSSLADYEFALPPLAAQTRLREGLAAWQAVLDALRKAIVPAGGLFDSLCEALLLPPGSPADRSPSSASSQSWTTSTIEGLCTESQALAIGPNGENLTRADYEGRKSGVPVIFMRDIRANRFCYVSDTFISPEKAARLPIHFARPGDIVITKMGHPEGVSVPPGLAAVVPETMAPAVVTAAVLRVRVSRSIAIPEFVAYLLNSPWGRAQTWRMCPGSAGRFKMRLASLAQLKLSVPPLPVQERVVEQLRQQARTIDCLVERLGKARSAMGAVLNRELSAQ
jgi:type I restriction enzyme S subunit